MQSWLVAVLLGLLATGAQAAYRIERVEPASWWVGMKNSRLQLLVHGEAIAELEPALAYPGVSIVRVTRTENPNYLFIDLAIAAEAQAGALAIDFRRRNKSVLRREYRLDAREPGSAARRGFDAGDAIYLVMPDRFANGDPGNDSREGLVEGVDRDDPDARHGGDLRGIRDRLDYIAGLGFTQLWLNPVFQSNQPRGSYHGYAITDFYRIDERLGDNALYRSLSRDAKAHGIGLVMDVVLNHCGSEHWWMRDPPDPDWINHDGRFVGTTHRRETLHDPHASRADRDAFSDGWFVPAMPDLNQRHPLLATYLVQNTIWWIEYAGLSGLRVDTLSYSDRDFLGRWYERVLEEYPSFSVVGEEWSLDPAIVSRWQPGVMDFPLQNAVVRGLVEPEGRESGMLRIYQALADDFLYQDPARLVVFPDNHDMSRIYTQLGERLDLYRMALALFATVRGIPQFTYGSEILMANPGTEAHGVIRQDFPVERELTGAERDAQEYTRKLLGWRKTATAVHDGALTQYAPQDDVYVFFRHDNRQKIMVAFNKADDGRRVEMSRFTGTIGESRRARDVLSGREFAVESTLALPPRSVTILELGGEPPLPAGVTGTVKTRESFPSKHVAARRVDVWLPPGYEANPDRRYPVLYMHDGQNLFDPALSYIGVDWGIDESMTRLIREGAVREAIVVGVWNTPKRFEEYVPAKAVSESKMPDDWADLSWLRKATLVSDDYLRFLVEELKPFVDSTYRTLPDRANTFTMGSSAGALISIYALAEYPDVFGGAGGVSTHWPLGDGLMIDYLAPRLAGLRGGHRFYFDFGTATLDAGYEPYQRRVDALLRRAGYVEGVDWMTRKYAGDEHSERAWRRRVDVPLRFLLGRRPGDQNR